MKVDFSASRRHILAGGAALAATPVLSGLPAMALAGAAPTTVTAQLWAQAEAVRQALAPHAATIAEAHARTGLPGWMHVAGRANELGNKRYHLLVKVLVSQPASKDDLVLIARATHDPDMQNGPRSWAHAQFDRAAREYHLSMSA